ncbi:MAG: MarR family winged helix-turn-helix transcriptional regulator [Vicinamibacterales bacterium]
MPRSPERPTLADLPCACATARRVARTLTQLYDAHLRPFGLENTQFLLLSLLDASGPSTQAALGERFGFDKTTLSRNLKVLRTKGWIADAAAVSARERPCMLTARGRQRLDAARPAWRRAQKALRASLGEPGWDAMWAAFGLVTAATRGAPPAPRRPVRHRAASRPPA